MTAVAPTFSPMLARPFARQEVRGWLMSEKLDGVRAIWDGARLISRNGNPFAAPAAFLASLPAGVMLDGELTMGRGKFQPTVAAVRRKIPRAAEWDTIRFEVFDAPQAPGGFEERLAFAAAVLDGSPIAATLPQTLCESLPHLDRYFLALTLAGAEGIMLRAPRSLYENRRSPLLLKYKPFESDEAEMIGTEPGEGRCQGIAGAFLLRWNDITFRVGTGITDELRATPPAPGAKITFGFCGLTDSGIPRFPTFLAERSYE